MRDASIAVLREIGVETGGSNVQFAVNPDNGRMIVIEMNPRVSRSSALASKATGFPIAKVAAQARRRLHARRDRQRHHRRRDAGLVRADDRLRRHQDPALRLREVPRRRADADDVDEVGRRGDGDRPHLPGIAAEGAALAGDRASPASTRSRSRASARATTRTPSAPRSARRRRTGCCKVAQAHAPRLRRRRDLRGLQDRPLVPRADRRHRRHRGEGAQPTACPTTPGAFRQLKAMGFSDARLAVLARLARGRGHQARAGRSTCARSTSASTPARPSSPRPPPTCTRPTRRPSPARRPTRRGPSDAQEGRHPRRRAEPHRPGHRVRLLLLPRLLRAARRRATRPSWSTATRRPSRPTTTPPTGSISSR